MLQRSSQVGEFYRMAPPPVWDVAKLLPSNYMGKPFSHKGLNASSHTPPTPQV